MLTPRTRFHYRTYDRQHVCFYQVFMMIQSGYDKRYSEILASATRTTRRICFTAAALALTVIFRRRVDIAVRSTLAGVASLASRAF